MKPGATGLTRILRAAGYSWQGLKAAFRFEAAFRQELALLLVLTPLALWLGEDGVDYALLIGSAVLVVLAELINSAIEAVVDRIGDEPHELSARAKDMGSAVVFVALVDLVMVWFFVLVY